MSYINLIRSQTRLVGEIFKKVSEAVARGEPADKILTKTFRLRKEIGSRDRKLLNDIIFSYYRWKGWLKFFGMLNQEEIFALALILDGKNYHTVCSHWQKNLEVFLPNIDSIDISDNLNEKKKIFLNLRDDNNNDLIKEIFPSWLSNKILLS